MAPSVIALTAPLDLTALPTHPIFQWYAHYAATFDSETIAAGAKTPTKFYASTAVNYAAEGSILRGAEDIWKDYEYLWGSFAKLTREPRTMILVSDEEKGTHTMHVEVVTTCHLKGAKGIVSVPTAFVYVIGKAEEDGGTDGWQIWEIRSYLDRATVERAKAMQMA